MQAAARRFTGKLAKYALTSVIAIGAGQSVLYCSTSFLLANRASSSAISHSSNNKTAASLLSADQKRPPVPPEAGLTDIVDDLHAGIQKGSSAQVKQLLKLAIREEGDENASPDRFRDRVGRTPFLTAIHFKKRNLAKFLLIQGSDINACDKHGLNGLEYAAMNGDTKMAGDLLHQGIETHRYDYFGLTALHKATAFGTTEIAELILERNAVPVDYKTGPCTVPKSYVATSKFESSLHIAARKNNTRMIETLLRHGASTDVRNCFGDLPLHTAVKWNNKEAMLLLLSQPSGERDASVSNKDGQTPRQMCEGGLADCIHVNLAFAKRKWQQYTSTNQ